jgi:hypothetical protein
MATCSTDKSNNKPEAFATCDSITAVDAKALTRKQQEKKEVRKVSKQLKKSQQTK